MSCFLFDRELNRKQAQGTQEDLPEYYIGSENKYLNKNCDLRDKKYSLRLMGSVKRNKRNKR